jgi:hypothetical protein
MKMLFPAVLFAAGVLSLGSGHAADGCGPGCRSAPFGECVVDGWAAGGPVRGVRNECPAGARPRPPCGHGYIWKFGACFPN